MLAVKPCFLKLARDVDGEPRKGGGGFRLLVTVSRATEGFPRAPTNVSGLYRFGNLDCVTSICSSFGAFSIEIRCWSSLTKARTELMAQHPSLSGSDPMSSSEV